MTYSLLSFEDTLGTREVCFQGRTRKRFYTSNVRREIRTRVPVEDAKCEGINYLLSYRGKKIEDRLSSPG